MRCASCGAAACGCEGNPRLYVPGSPGDPAGPLGHPARSLVESLGETVDSIRQLYTDIGLRPYRVVSVVYRWTGGDVGRGRAEVISERELLPTPRLLETTGIAGEQRSAGLVERGSVRLEQISPRYTEDEVRALFFTYPLPVGTQGFIEIRIDARDGSTERRRFIVRGMPYRDAEGFQWKATLLRQDEDRTRAGRPAPPP